MICLSRTHLSCTTVLSNIYINITLLATSFYKQLGQEDMEVRNVTGEVGQLNASQTINSQSPTHHQAFRETNNEMMHEKIISH